MSRIRALLFGHSETPKAPGEHPIVPRKMDFPFSTSGIPRYWIGNSGIATHMSNALHLIFPMGERFFIRSVRHYLDRIDDETLNTQIRRFFGQEGHHAREHERFYDVLREQGYDIDSFLDRYEKIAYQFLEPKFSPELRLSVTAALEHFTAMFAEGALTPGNMERVHPVVRDLIRWHASEEIEHKAVAFDVLQRVNPSYRLRIRGITAGFIVLVGFWIMGTVMMMRQDDRKTSQVIKEIFGHMAGGNMVNGEMWRAFFDYLRPDFHPSDIDNYHLALDYLASKGLAAEAA